MIVSDLDTRRKGVHKVQQNDKTPTPEKKFTVRICEEYLFREPDKVNAILDRVSRIISNSYIEKARVQN